MHEAYRKVRRRASPDGRNAGAFRTGEPGTQVNVRLGDLVLDRETLERAMRRALELALRGPEHDPNPQVGCVLLDPSGTIVAEGWHLGSGTPHAETAALAALPDTWRGREHELTAVVTLEPCNHTGRTGPCAVALADAGIGAVVYAVSDPGDASAGGAHTLRTAGIAVTEGILADEARAQLAPWLDRQTRVSTGSASGVPRPHITVKWAQTLDGRAAAADGSSQWITGPEARRDVHQRRATADAILVGTGTLLDDNPALTARDGDGHLLVPAAEQPLPVVFGRREIPEHSALWRHPALAAHGLSAPLQYPGDDLTAHLADLHTRGVRRVFVEGGPSVASSLLREGLADEVLVYVAPALLGGPNLAIGDLGITSMSSITRLRVTSVTPLGEDLLITAALTSGEAAPRPAAQTAPTHTDHNAQEGH